MPCSCRPSSTGSKFDQSYAGSFGFSGCAGRFFATSLHTSVNRTVRTPSESSVSSRLSSVPGPQRSQASSWMPIRALALADALAARSSARIAAAPAARAARLMPPPYGASRYVGVRLGLRGCNFSVHLAQILLSLAKCLDDRRVELLARAREDLLARDLPAERAAVRPVARHRVEGVRDGEDPRPERDLPPREP